MVRESMEKVCITLEHEYAAVRLLKNNLESSRKQLPPHTALEKLRYLLNNHIEVKGVPVPVIADSDDSNFLALIEHIHQEVIFDHPVLLIMTAHNETLPDLIHVREDLKSNFLTDEVIEIVENSLRTDFPINQGTETIELPIRLFMVGKLLNILIDRFYHLQNIDKVKEAGTEESIEELRNNRVYKSDEGTVFDYSPFYRSITTENGSYIFDVCEEENYAQLTSFRKDNLYGQLHKIADKEAILGIQKVFYQQNPLSEKRLDNLFGGECDTPDRSFTIRCGSKQESIPLRLLPRWKPKIIYEANKFNLTTLRDDFKKEEIYKKEDESQEAIFGLFKGAIAWNEEEGPVDYYLRENIKWRMGHAFEELSSEVHDLQDSIDGEKQRLESAKKPSIRKHYSSIEQSGGSLEDPLLSKSEEGPLRRDEVLRERDGLSGEEYLSTEKQVNGTEFREGIEQLKKALTDNADRKIIGMLLNGRKQNEIAEAMGISPPAINKRIKNIPKKLPAELSRHLKNLL
jgi:RNA polymerase sigma factor (sigma-70 family)